MSTRALLWFLPLFLVGCSPEAGEAFADALAQVLIVSMVLAAMFACVGLAVMAVELLVVIVNFARPSRWSMVTGYVLAGLHAASMVGTVLWWSAPSPPPDPNAPLITIGAGSPEVGGIVMGLLTGLAFAGLLGGSSYYAQRKLAPPPVATE